MKQNSKDEITTEDGHSLQPDVRSGFYVYSYRDETSSFDSLGTWEHGTECYMRDYRCWLPNESKDWSEDEIANHIDDNCDSDDFWLE